MLTETISKIYTALMQPVHYATCLIRLKIEPEPDFTLGEKITPEMSPQEKAEAIIAKFNKFVKPGLDEQDYNSALGAIVLVRKYDINPNETALLKVHCGYGLVSAARTLETALDNAIHGDPPGITDAVKYFKASAAQTKLPLRPPKD